MSRLRPVTGFVLARFLWPAKRFIQLPSTFPRQSVEIATVPIILKRRDRSLDRENPSRVSGGPAPTSHSSAFRVVSVVLLLLMVHFGRDVTNAQSPELVTDRPDQTESATVVAGGLVQVEMGYLFARDGGVDRYEVPGTLVRVGLGGRTELRVGHTGVAGGGEGRGAGDSTLGAKFNLIGRADGWLPELAILGGVSLPTGDHGFSSNGVDPSFLFSLAYELSPRLSFGANVGSAWESSSEGSGREATFLYSLVLGGGVTERLGVFLELFGDWLTTGANATGVSVDGGFTFLLADLVQFDLYVGRGLRGTNDDAFIGTGLSFRLPR